MAEGRLRWRPRREGRSESVGFSLGHCTLGSGRVSHRRVRVAKHTLRKTDGVVELFYRYSVHMLSKFVKFSFHTSVAKTLAKNSPLAGARVAIESCPAPTNAIPATNLFTACPPR